MSFREKRLVCHRKAVYNIGRTIAENHLGKRLVMSPQMAAQYD